MEYLYRLKERLTSLTLAAALMKTVAKKSTLEINQSIPLFITFV